ncbi:uncharacterized protein LOC113562792 [Ooceraea biroi]|uniref:uncharacterized protein LOC113562792 n=1 Tax=Ooceraea biroi TaxID=2015173 RepID=UPI000F09125F|nr:uncharacterized protein LOC105278894 isoform X1 [Ooceraea biroi]XP_026829054.1 uncharacterized protein LOC105278894 isoform X1 [Ooceraea biroi]XP_026829056.1 uncharacterized protein LOC113562792 [Ooceraea biroi]XP_026829057.1 uncharacterized protein LOC113562792 [Ooceraea biroi]
MQYSVKYYVQNLISERNHKKKFIISKPRILYENVLRLKKKYRRLKNIVNEIKRKKYITNSEQTLCTSDNKGRIDKTASAMQQQFIDIVLRNNNVAPQARRYAVEDKLFCISIYRRIRSSYNFSSKYLLCPSSNTLLDTQFRNTST